MGISLGWGGYVDTDLSFAEFFGSDHTVVVRFMPQYPHAYTGPVVAENGGGSYRIGMGDFLSGPAQPKLELQVGQNRATYPADLKAGVWHHLAAVRSGKTYTLFLDGVKLNPALPVGAAALPTGALRLGRRTDGQMVFGRPAQFYGLIDQAAVFRRALSAPEIQHLAAPAAALTGAEPEICAGWRFTPPPAPGEEALPPALARPVALKGTVRLVTVSPNRESAVDAKQLPLPSQQAAMQLPFPEEQAWYVIQGVDDPAGSHKGYAAFCWDLMLAGKPQPVTKGLPFQAAAPGTVLEVKQDSVSGEGNAANNIMIQQAPGEICGYLHLLPDTVKVQAGVQVKAGQELAATGDTGAAAGAYHLHLAVSNVPESQHNQLVTIPAAFSDYEVSADEGQTWRYLFRGVPRQGEWVRRIRPPLPDFHGLPAQRFQTAFDYWAHRNCWPVTLSPSLWNGKIYMAGSMQSGPSRPVRHLIPAIQYEQDFAYLRDRGFRPAHVMILKTGDGLRFTAIWAPVDGPFESRWGMTPAEFNTRWHLLREQGFLNTDLYAYQDDGLKFAATWVKKPFTDYATYFGMTAAQYQQRFNQFWQQGLRPTHFVAYPDAGDLHYAAIWEKVGGAWIHSFGMTGDEYQQKYNSYAAQGFRLHQIQAYGSRYSAIWRK